MRWRQVVGEMVRAIVTQVSSSATSPHDLESVHHYVVSGIDSLPYYYFYPTVAIIVIFENVFILVHLKRFSKLGLERQGRYVLFPPRYVPFANMMVKLVRTLTLLRFYDFAPERGDRRK